MATYTGSSRVTPRRWLLMAVCGGAVALALGTSFGAWRLTQPGQVSKIIPVSQGQPHVQQSGMPPGNIAYLNSSRPAVPLVEAPSLVLVDSAEQAAAAQQGINDAEVIRTQLNLPPLVSDVLQVNGEADIERALQSIAAENSLRATLGLPSIRVVDLREQ